MSMNDPLAGVLSQIDNAIKAGKQEVTTKVSSNLIKQVLAIMTEKGYVGEVTENVSSRGNSLTIKLSGRMNKCGVVKPRYAVPQANFERYEKQFLPARGFGYLLISTNQGLLTHEDAKEKGIGGRLISYCY